ncbi:MAG TPA: hypothetical protein VJR70_05495 [Stellaceae bacterium]|nr:hypothetical protein [Stellaceae bacterium]
MRNAIIVTCGLSLILLAGAANAADHLFTGVGAGGITTSSQPFLNGTTNPGRSGLTVPGQGSPLSGEDRTTPAVETGQLLTHHFSQPNLNANPGNGMLRMPPPAAAGMTVPMGHGRR